MVFIYNLLYQYEIHPGNMLEGFRIDVYKQHQKMRILRFNSVVTCEEEILENRIQVLHSIIFKKCDLSSAFLKINHLGDHVTFEIVDFHKYPFKRDRYTRELICAYIPIKKYKDDIIWLLRRLNQSQITLQNNVLSDVAIDVPTNGLLLSSNTLDRKISFIELLQGLPYGYELNHKYYSLRRNNTSSKIEIVPIIGLADLHCLTNDILMSKNQLMMHIIEPLFHFNPQQCQSA